jgi:D-glycero-alpha-D-manno-heptose-7-phosphate kinase
MEQATRVLKEGEANMIISRAPMRISFGGGGADLEAYYARYGGFVLSTAINHYCYAMASASLDGGVHIRMPDPPTGETHSSALPEAAIEMFTHKGLSRRGVALTLASDVPPGAGLGSSSAMAVALIHALAGYLRIPLTAAEIARRACELEIERLGMSIGKQDQYASAYGGLNGITFARDGSVDVRPLPLPPWLRRALHARLLLFDTGGRHNSSAILRRQSDDTRCMPTVVARLHRIKALGLAMRDLLLAGDLDGFGRLLDRAWREKRSLSAAISNTSIDTWYFAARSAGALGGKITGAGGGGFLLLYAPPEKIAAVRAALNDCGLRELPFAFEAAGVQALSSLALDLPDAVSARFLAHDAPTAMDAMEGGVSHA